MNNTSINTTIPDYFSEFTKFTLTKYSINGSKKAVYILYNDILKLNKICENIIYEVRLSNKHFNKDEIVMFTYLIEFKDKLNTLCKKWDEKHWNWVFRYTGHNNLESVSKLEIILDSVHVNGMHQFIMFYTDLTNLFQYRKNFFMDILKTNEVIDTSHKD